MSLKTIGVKRVAILASFMTRGIPRLAISFLITTPLIRDVSLMFPGIL